MELKVHTGAKALIFDLDGTLSDSLPMHVAAWKKVGEKYGFDFNPEIVYELTGRPTIEFAKRIIKEYGIKADPQKMVDLKLKTFWNSADLIKSHEKVTDIVKSWYKKLPMSVGTGASRKSAEIQLNAMKIYSFFDFIITADDVKKHKPEPDTFLECARLMGVHPSECQVFEDGDVGIEAAKRAGMIITDVRPALRVNEL
jgi:beta-phosphoglucomutase family hydrolase